jgi:hypothetical protein
MGPASSSKYPNDILATREGCEINYFDKTPEVVVSKAVLKKIHQDEDGAMCCGGPRRSREPDRSACCGGDLVAAHPPYA